VELDQVTEHRRCLKRSRGACHLGTVPERTIAYGLFNHLPTGAPVPVDAVTASGSGLDPDISLANALDQAPRVARARHLPSAKVIGLVRRVAQGRQLGFLGEPAVNVLQLNLDLGKLR
jgi:potassium-transporting ATPase KdpC subunit